MKSPILTVLVPLSSDLDGIYLHYQYNIKQATNKNKEKYQLGDKWLIQFQIRQPNVTWIVWQTIKGITNEILKVKGLCNNMYQKYSK